MHNFKYAKRKTKQAIDRSIVDGSIYFSRGYSLNLYKGGDAFWTDVTKVVQYT